MKILIVEDDITLNNGIALSFKDEEILQAFSLNQAKDKLSEKPDLIILDINLPDGNGIDFCKYVKSVSKTSVIFLTANDTEIDIVTGLENGADDYITKPFSLAVLRARVNTVLRRNENNNRYKDDKFIFDFDNMSFFVCESEVFLSKTEQKLLRLFIENKGITLNREMIIERVWGCDMEFVETNALSVAVNRLKKKLDNPPIKTVYGIGYVWEENINR